MNFIPQLKDNFFYFLEKTNAGKRMVFFVKKKLGRLPVVDLTFPTSIHLEISSLCNLSCIHCPSHLPSLKKMAKPHGLMKMEIFNKAIDEIDAHGPKRLALHKDGEPLLHPHILTILGRVKKNQPHFVTLITNGHFLTDEITDAILSNHIDSVIFSIGAASRSFYEKVRGNGYDLVMDNIRRFLEKREASQSATDVTVQIVNLPEFPGMKDEIGRFKNLWKGKPVTVMVFDELNWGVFDTGKVKLERYACPSLWRNVFVHWDGKVSPCCMDWNQSLSLGDFYEYTLSGIWSGDLIKSFRQAHLNKQFASLPLCEKCNYWSTVTRLDIK